MSRTRLISRIFTDVFRAVEPAPFHPQPSTWRDDQVTAAWLGHATVLINFYGVTILTDPVFFARCGIHLGPFTLGPKRYIACALAPPELPPIDLVLLSHAHMDHLDLPSLRCINPEAAIITAQATKDVFHLVRFREVTELAWNEDVQMTTSRGVVTVAAFRLRHWGARMQRDEHRRYNAYLLERNGTRLCFMGDTAYIDATHLSRRGAIDLMIVPIGAYQPWIRAHCTPEQAVTMADQAQARFLIPVHHQTFKLSWEPMNEPVVRFTTALSNAPERIALTRIGETFVLPSGRAT